MKRFPILKPPVGCAKYVDWNALDPVWAKHVHGQTLERLAERGGLCPEEIVLNIHKLTWGNKVNRDYAVRLVNSLSDEVGVI